MNEVNNEELVKKLSMLAGRSAGWMKFLGVVSIIFGVLYVFTIWGIIFAWLPIWVGVILFQAAGDAETASLGMPTRLLQFVQRLNKYFLIQGIATLVMLIVIFVVVILGAAMFIGMGRHGMGLLR